jgi:hypothetical protein
MAVMASALLVFAQGKTPRTERGMVCWPLHFAGITVGINDDAEAQRLLGKGVFRPDEGHTGGRYYLDAKHTATLHIVDGVDNVVEELTVSSGIDAEIKPKEQAAAVSNWFHPQESFGNWHALHLGSTKSEVLGNLGEPRKKVKADEWVYETKCECELPEYLTLKFSKGRVVVLNLYAGE